MTERVCIANADTKKPIFHKIGEFENHRDGGLFQTTGCNIATVHWMFGIDSIRREHAECFAVPCQRCFPEEARREQ